MKYEDYRLFVVMRVVFHFKQVGCFKVQLLLVVALLFPFNAYCQAEGESLFKGYCVACHTIGQGRLVGPDLKGVTEKYDESWLISFIQSSQTMVAQGDEKAVAVFNEFMIPMPDQPLNSNQITNLLNYIEIQSLPHMDEESTDLKDSNNITLKKPSSVLPKELSFVEIVLIAVMSVELITILVLINLVFILSKYLRLANK